MTSETASNQTVFLVEDDAVVHKGCKQALSIADRWALGQPDAFRP